MAKPLQIFDCLVSERRATNALKMGLAIMGYPIGKLLPSIIFPVSLLWAVKNNKWFSGDLLWFNLCGLVAHAGVEEAAAVAT